MRKRDHRKSHRDLGLFGVALFSVAIITAYAMYAHDHTGLIEKLLCEPLFWMFADFAWFVPIIIAMLGIILICEASEPIVMTTMSLAAASYLLLFATIYHLGAAGHALSNISTFLFGDFSYAVIDGLFGILTFSMLGASLRDNVAQAFRAAMHVCQMLWNICLRLPSTIVASKKCVVPPPTQAKTTSPAMPIALPARIIPTEEPIIDVEFVDIPEQKVHHAHSSYRLPHLSFFNQPVPFRGTIDNREQVLVDALASFGVGVTVTNKTVGSSVTRYELSPDKGVPVGKITRHANDIALALAARSIRIEAPIPGKSAVGIEVPNTTPATVTIREILETMHGSNDSLKIALGKDITGKPITADLRTMPHLLVAGATGSGKSICLNTIIASLLLSSTPDHVQMLFIDPKRVELSVYNGIPHLIQQVITDAGQAASALQAMSREMDARYAMFEQHGIRDIGEYNARYNNKKIPYV
jgi:hypothetical protein